MTGWMDGEDEDSMGPLAGNSVDSEPLELAHFPGLTLVTGLNAVTKLTKSGPGEEQSSSGRIVAIGVCGVGFSSHALAVGQHEFQQAKRRKNSG